MTSQGSPYARFRRAIDSGNPTIALAAARELPHLNLADALALLLVLRGDHRYPKAAARWHARFVMEAPVTLTESHLTLCALTALPDQHAAPAVARSSGCSRRSADARRVSVRSGPQLNEWENASKWFNVGFESVVHSQKSANSDDFDRYQPGTSRPTP